MDSTQPIADLGPRNRAREQKAWFFYDWANSAFATTIAGVLFAPYLIAVAEGAAAAAVLFFMTDDNWQIGVVAFIVANLCFAASTVFNDAILPLISTEAE